MTKVALLPRGSVSDEAARYLFDKQHVDFMYFKEISDVFQAAQDGRADYAIIPIENTIEGSVSLHADWLVHEVDVPIQAEWVYPSRQNVIGRSNVSLESVKKIYSHPVAIAQCLHFIRAVMPSAEHELVSSTAEAVRLVSELEASEGAVAIGTKLAAELYGLDVLREQVTDHDNNYTRFLLIGNKPFVERTSEEKRTTILVTLPEDYPGALHQVLSAFAWRRINLSRIESRPTKKKLGNYFFFMDIEQSLESKLLQLAIEEIRTIGCTVRILGTYPSFIGE